MAENATFLQRFKKELSELTKDQILSYILQFACLSLSFTAIYWHIFDINIEEIHDRNTLDAYIIILLGLVGAMWFCIMDMEREIDEIKKEKQ